MINAYKDYWSNMTVMNASATRSQYWWPQVLNVLIWTIFYAVSGVYKYIEITPEDVTLIREWNVLTILFVIISVLIWLANFTVRARRFHDRNHSNWWILFYMVPFIGPIVIFITLLLPSKQETRWPRNQSDY